MMKSAIKILTDMGIPHEVKVISGHRTHQRKGRRQECTWMRTQGHHCWCGRSCSSSLTHLPVIGVLIASQLLDGQESLSSMIQMPREIPVATVGYINNSLNAGLMAVRMLGTYLIS